MTYIKRIQALFNKEFRLPLLILLLTAFAIGYLFNSGSTPEAATSEHDHQEMTTTWTCSMHPQIQQPNSGQCPICGMDLIPLADNTDEQLGPRELKLSENAQKLANIQTATVRRQPVSVELRLSGKLFTDETRVKYIAARVPGRIDRLFVDYQGTRVRKGDHLVQLYSPRLISAQEEFLQAYKTFQLNPTSSFGLDAKQTLDASEEKLKQLGLTGTQIRGLEKRKAVSERLTIYSPISGTVIHRNATEGMYVDTGEEIYTVADLRYLWLKLDAYETDLPWLHLGQTVLFSVKAWPGEEFEGSISFIDPLINPQTRTTNVRVNVRNSDGRLKPHMFARAMIRAEIESGTRISNRALAGKWISPMHPEIVKDTPGNCDVCGMRLVRAEELGIVGNQQNDSLPPLIIPSSAVLKTGKRAVVYLAKGNGLFEGREIMLGSRAGESYIVLFGLKEGDTVVTNGAFKLDSDLQIKARPSMMNPPNQPITSHHHHADSEMKKRFEELPPSFSKSVNKIITAYLEIQRGLSHDSLTIIPTSSTLLQNAVLDVKSEGLSKKAKSRWQSVQTRLKEAAAKINVAKDIENAREAFQNLSNTAIELAQSFGNDITTPLYLMHCPMAFNDSGADWLQENEKIENPYFGSSMFRCGSVKETIHPVGGSR